MESRPGPHDLRASDADRELVIGMLAEAAADGRLTPAEHEERVERAYAARTLGELSALTTDLAPPSAQPIRLDSQRAVIALFRREARQGRWVVPDGLAVTALFGEVTLDLRDAVFQGIRPIINATVVAGQIRLIVPEGVSVEMVGRGVPGTGWGRGPWPQGAGPVRPGGASPRTGAWASGTNARAPGTGGGVRQGTGGLVIEVRSFVLGGRVKVITPRRSRWFRRR